MIILEINLLEYVLIKNIYKFNKKYLKKNN